MILCEVVGNIVSTIKVDQLKKYKLLIVRPVGGFRVSPKKSDDFDTSNSTLTANAALNQSGPNHTGSGQINCEQVAVDLVGAGEGDMVVVLQGSQINNIEKSVPSDNAIVGIVEKVNKKA